MPDDRDVVVTGAGVVSPYGRGLPALWDALVAGKSAIDKITSFDASPYASQVAGEIKGYEPPAAIAERASRADRAAVFAADAALQAVEDAALPLTPDTTPHIGVVVGVARPGETSVWHGHRSFHQTGRLGGGHIPRSLANAPVALVSATLGVRGPTLSVSTGGSSGASAIATAASMVRRGEVEVVVAGGADAAITPPAIAAFSAMGVLTTRNDEPERACRPFDAEADGFAVSEGAAFLILESEELAQQRGARIVGRISGAASVTEPGALVPSEGEAGRALQAALRQPALLQSEIDYFCAYAPGSLEIDAMENAAVKRIFGAVAAEQLTISAPKSMLGHMLGAAGVVDAIICLKAIHEGVIPPTINLETPAAGCDLDYTAGEARRQAVRHALTYAYGWGGHHLSLCISAP